LAAEAEGTFVQPSEERLAAIIEEREQLDRSGGAP
jgi:hypothetical protein